MVCCLLFASAVALLLLPSDTELYPSIYWCLLQSLMILSPDDYSWHLHPWYFRKKIVGIIPSPMAPKIRFDGWPKPMIPPGGGLPTAASLVWTTVAMLRRGGSQEASRTVVTPSWSRRTARAGILDKRYPPGKQIHCWIIAIVALGFFGFQLCTMGLCFRHWFLAVIQHEHALINNHSRTIH